MSGSGLRSGTRYGVTAISDTASPADQPSTHLPTRRRRGPAVVVRAPTVVALTGDEHAAAVRAFAALLPAALAALAAEVPAQRDSQGTAS